MCVFAEHGTIATASVVFPQPPAAGETVAVACSSSDARIATVSNGNFLITSANYGADHVFSIAGVPDWVNDEPRDQLFRYRYCLCIYSRCASAFSLAIMLH